MKNILLFIFLMGIFASCVQEIPVEEEEFFIESENKNSVDVQDTLNPKLLNLSVIDITKISAVINLSLDEKANAKIEFGQTTSYGTSLTNMTYLSEHSFALTSLKEDTTYYYRLVFTDKAGNELVTATQNFKTQATVDITPPTLSNFKPSGVVLSASSMIELELSLSSNEAATCRYSASDSADFNQMSAMALSGSSSHKQSISGEVGKSYNYYVLCQDGSGNQSIKETISFNVTESAIDGSALYSNHCMSCHNALDNSTKKNRSTAQVQEAIDNNSVMKNISGLKNLSLAQVEAIAAALKINQAPPSDSAALDNQEFQIGTRKYLNAKFLALFYVGAPDSQVKALIETYILNDEDGNFGGFCTYQDRNCLGDSLITTAGSLLPTSSPIRSAKLHNLCQEVLGRANAIQSALKAAELSVSSSGDSSANIAKLFDAFYPGITLSSEASTSLINLYKAGKAKNFSDSNAWKMVLDPLCKSALFETF